MPVYNVEKYLDAAIVSLLEQTIGFRENIQLILVNDGSSDGSGEICEFYQKSYPDNIIYIDKPNGGVSSARNAGMPYAMGEFVNFMDSDDTWHKRSFAKVDEFIENNPGIKIISARLKFDDRKKGDKYILDYVYRTTRTANIFSDPDLPLFSVSRTFFAKELLSGRSFDETISVSEDQLFLTKLLLEEKDFGVVREAVYNYRKRFERDSIFDNSVASKEYYTVTPNKVFKELLRYSRELYGEVIPYVQRLMAANMQWRIKNPKKEIDFLTDDERTAYLESLKDILKEVGDNVLADQMNIPLWYKMYEILIKHDGDLSSLDPVLLDRMANKVRMAIRPITMKDGKLLIRGVSHERWLDENIGISVFLNGKEFGEMEYIPDPEHDKTGIYSDVVIHEYKHEIELPVKDGDYSFFLRRPGKELRQLVISNTSIEAINERSEENDLFTAEADENIVRIKVKQ